jgi:hypothetical protein
MADRGIAHINAMGVRLWGGANIKDTRNVSRSSAVSALATFNIISVRSSNMTDSSRQCAAQQLAELSREFLK